MVWLIVYDNIYHNLTTINPLAIRGGEKKFQDELLMMVTDK